MNLPEFPTVFRGYDPVQVDPGQRGAVGNVNDGADFRVDRVRGAGDAHRRHAEDRAEEHPIHRARQQQHHQHQCDDPRPASRGVAPVVGCAPVIGPVGRF